MIEIKFENLEVPSTSPILSKPKTLTATFQENPGILPTGNALTIRNLNFFGNSINPDGGRIFLR